MSAAVLIPMVWMFHSFARSSQTNDSRVQLARKAAIYALPLVIMDITREQFFASPASADATPNRFFHVPILGSARSRTVVRPNVDTIYSSAWLELADGPVVMTLPPSNGRYFLVQCMDAWTNVFADPGIRTLGDRGAKYAIVGPDWHGSLPVGVSKVRSPTQMAWVLARIYVRDQADLPAARAFQRELDLRPLNESSAASFQPAYPRLTELSAPRVTTMDALRAMKPDVFWQRFLKLTADNSPSPDDAPFIKQALKPLGVTPGAPKSWTEFDEEDRRNLAEGVRQVIDALGSPSSSQESSSTMSTGWRGTSPTMAQGSYGTDYLRRAIVALWGLGANLRADAVYLTTSVDGIGDRLDGSRRYSLTFGSGGTPPVAGFWSMTLYDANGYLVENPMNRNAIRSGSDLALSQNGSLTIYLQPDDPGPDRHANWLPTPRGETFELTLRAYWPSDALLAWKWTPPPVLPVK